MIKVNQSKPPLTALAAIVSLLPSLTEPSLKLLLVIAERAPNNAPIRLTFDELQAATGLSRQSVSVGIAACLKNGLLARPKQSTYCTTFALADSLPNGLPDAPQSTKQTIPQSTKQTATPTDSPQSRPTQSTDHTLTVYEIDRVLYQDQSINQNQKTDIDLIKKYLMELGMIEPTLSQVLATNPALSRVEDLMAKCHRGSGINNPAAYIAKSLLNAKSNVRAFPAQPKRPVVAVPATAPDFAPLPDDILPKRVIVPPAEPMPTIGGDTLIGSMTALDLWQTVKYQMAAQIDRGSYETFFKNAQFLSYADGFTIAAPSAYIAEMLNGSWLPKVKRVLNDIADSKQAIAFVCEKEAPHALAQ